MRFFLCLLVLIIIVPALVSLAARKTTGLHYETTQNTNLLDGQNELQYKFVSPLDNLNSLSLRFKNPNMINRQNTVFSLSTNNQKLVEIEFNGSNAKDGDWTRFSFKPIKNSDNKQFMITLISPLSVSDQALSVYVDNDNQPALITYHQITSHQKLIFSVYSNLFAMLTKDPVFLTLWLVTILSLAGKLYIDFRVAQKL